MNYQRMVHEDDSDIPYLLSVLHLPEVARYISIDEKNYWHYVTATDHVFYYKVYDGDRFVGATHCELQTRTLYMDILVFPQYQKQGVGIRILRDIQAGTLPLAFDTIEVSIDEANLASIRLFEKAGFQHTKRDEELLTYVWHR